MELIPEILLTPTIPEELHGFNPRTDMGVYTWTKFRKPIVERWGMCAACGAAAKRLELHEWYSFDYRQKRSTVNDFVPLCGKCHGYCHFGGLRSRMVDAPDGNRVIEECENHALVVLKMSGLIPMSLAMEIAKTPFEERFGTPMRFGDAYLERLRVVLRRSKHRGISKRLIGMESNGKLSFRVHTSYRATGGSWTLFWDGRCIAGAGVERCCCFCDKRIVLGRDWLIPRRKIGLPLVCVECSSKRMPYFYETWGGLDAPAYVVEETSPQGIRVGMLDQIISRH